MQWKKISLSCAWKTVWGNLLKHRMLQNIGANKASNPTDELEQRPPWHPDFLLHFTCVSAYATRLVRYIPCVGRKSISVNHYGVERTANLVTNTRLLKVLGFWENQTTQTPCAQFECGITKTLTTVFRTNTITVPQVLDRERDRTLNWGFTQVTTRRATLGHW